jgi:hypothetical protein
MWDNLKDLTYEDRLFVVEWGGRQRCRTPLPGRPTGPWRQEAS